MLKADLILMLMIHHHVRVSLPQIIYVEILEEQGEASDAIRIKLHPSPTDEKDPEEDTS